METSTLVSNRYLLGPVLSEVRNLEVNLIYQLPISFFGTLIRSEVIRRDARLKMAYVQKEVK